MSHSATYEEAYKHYIQKGGSAADGLAALALATTVQEAMEVYNAADGMEGHLTCCEAAFAKALELSLTDIDFDIIMDRLNETGLTSYRYEVLKVFETMDARGIKAEQMGVKK